MSRIITREDTNVREYEARVHRAVYAAIIPDGMNPESFNDSTDRLVRHWRDKALAAVNAYATAIAQERDDWLLDPPVVREQESRPMSLVKTNETDPVQDELQISPETIAPEAALVHAASALALRRRQAQAKPNNPIGELELVETQARLKLAASIIALDNVDERIHAYEKIHSLQEQAAVDATKHEYAQALADLLRGCAS